jgi:molybdopterin molybdotransferase
VPVAEHARRVAALLAPTPVVHRPPGECAGRALAEPVRSGTDLPRFDTSAMDGFAVRAADAPAVLPVTGTVAAGARHLPVLAPGTAVRIMTGAPLPPGADAVVPVERVRSTADLVELPAVAPGAHVRRRGEDVAAGDVVLPTGTVLGPGRIAAALAAGAGTLAVHRRITVLVLSAGSELAAPGEPCGPGRVPDTNGAMLCAAVVAAGGTARQLPLVPDRPDDLARLLLPALAGADLLLTSGGISAGDHEVVKDVLGPAGVDFLRVAVKPGGPQGLGRVGGVPVVCLPGNPVACWVSFELFVRPALCAAMGLPAHRPPHHGPADGARHRPPGPRRVRPRPPHRRRRRRPRPRPRLALLPRPGRRRLPRGGRRPPGGGCHGPGPGPPHLTEITTRCTRPPS